MLSEPPRCRPVPVRALKGADSPRGRHCGHSPGHASPPGARSTGGGWSLPASWPDPNSLRQLNPDHDETYRVDRVIHASMGRLTGGLSPAALAGAYADWAVHLAFSPGKQVQLIGKAARKWSRFANHVAQCALSGRTCEPCIEPLPQDRRFAAKQ